MHSIAGIVFKCPQGTLVALAAAIVGVLAKMLVATFFHWLATNVAHGVATRRARHFVARVGFFEEGYSTVGAVTHLGVGQGFFGLTVALLEKYLLVELDVAGVVDLGSSS
jgi:hypothetical protein